MGDSVAKGAIRTSSGKPDQGRDGRDDSIGLIQTLQTSLDDIRALVTCRVCVRPLFEPYTIECGHTFCYSCLARWFERNRITKSCPDCRADVLRPPAPAYLVRDLTQIFTNRAELMPVGESTQEHKEWQEEEAALVERDKAIPGLKGGLFRGCFRLTRRRPTAAIRDDEDGVDRCPRCAWELQDGLCENCEYPEGIDSSEMSEIDGHGYWDEDQYDMDEAFMEELVEALDDDAHMDGYVPNIEYSGDEYSSEDATSEELPPRLRSEAEDFLSRTRQRDRRITSQPNRLRAHPEEETPYDTFPDDTDEGSEDEEVGSLDDFVVNDVETGPRSVTNSPRSLNWETDEGIDGEDDQQQTSDNDQLTQEYETSPTSAQYDPEDDSDEGPILRSRRQVRRRSVASDQSNGSDGNGGSGVSQALNALRVRNRYNSSDVSANSRRNIPPENPDANKKSSRFSPIEVESDSDSPVPAQRARRRRAVPNRLSLDDDSDVAASSGTVTVGRDSPKPSGGSITRNGGTLPASQASNTSSPILIGSSPTRSADRNLAVPGAFPQSSRPAITPSLHLSNSSRHIRRRTTSRDSHVATDSLQSISRPSATSASPSDGLRQHRGPRRRSPLPPRERPLSPTIRQSHSPTVMGVNEQGRRDRQAQKNERRAERRRLKAEREQRGWSQSGLLRSGS